MVITRLADISLVYIDDDLLVLEKPCGLLSVPGRGDDKQDCLSLRVQQRYPDARVVHRLDMATSGLMVMARSPLAQRKLNCAFSSRMIHKRYEAVVDGIALLPTTSKPEDWQEIDLPICLDWPNRPRRIIDVRQGKPSQTRRRVISLDIAQQTSRIALEPVTGRSHQLRVHLLAIHHPILGDTLYAPASAVAKSQRLLLHATQLDFVHPLSQQPVQFVSPAPF
ncbi:ribosomal large subunit pseudouridine synthase A [mine drainage metagenome]|uniref:Ribosomal large subunit pseudouridine synthase A n=1 Tax=mine drainage metagenome TaxID=410659 RepID=A0A1J5PX57_9ZZZZ